MKPEFSVDEAVIHSGNYGPLESVSHESIIRWVQLPLALVNNIRAQDKSDAGDSLMTTSDAWEVSSGWEERIKFYRLKYAKWNGPWRYSG